MKKLGILALSAVSFTTLKAQTLQDAIRKTDNEQYADALVDFNALLAKEPNNGANYFYFGDYYFERGEFEEAEAMWSKGARVDAIHPLSAVAKGRVLWMHGDQVGAKGLTPTPTPAPALKYSAAEIEPGEGGGTSLNAPCPCGSGKKYKRCHGAS